MSDIVFRRARREDLPALVALIADDAVNGYREQAGEPLPPGYATAFDAIAGDVNNVLVVGEMDGVVVATAQLTFVPTLVQKGATRAIIEGVRVSSSMRSRGIGEKLIAHCEGLAQTRGCIAVQLTTSHARADAHRFYERIGYGHTHKGFKREL
jgi:GNAT superfamily N-acetyltransferase